MKSCANAACGICSSPVSRRTSAWNRPCATPSSWTIGPSSSPMPRWPPVRPLCTTPRCKTSRTFSGGRCRFASSCKACGANLKSRSRPNRPVASLDFVHALAAFGAAFLAGVINSVAGGGTLVTFPTLIWLGLNSVTANATSSVAIWPGIVASAWGYRRELGTAEPRLFWLLIPSLVGGLAGAWLLRSTPPAVFDRLIPYLLLFATLLFMVQEPVQRWMKSPELVAHRSATWFVGVLFFQLFV